MSTRTPLGGGERLPMLDGWRAVSILLVLAAHLLPLGPKVLRLNEAAGTLGMAIFFTLSGFLITSFLLARDDVSAFLTRRFFRVVPLAWVYVTLLVLPNEQAPTVLAHYLFYGNLPPFWLVNITAHFWSLCVEVHFYVGVALGVALFGRRFLWVLPVLAVLVTAWRVSTGAHISIVTWLRLDEILAGSILALAFHKAWMPRLATLLRSTPPWAWLALAAVASHPLSGPMAYARPYLVACVVGSTVFAGEGRWAAELGRPVLAYIARISYALYVLHPALAHSWLGSGDVWVKYAKRPLLFAVLWLLAHLSTFQFERRCIALARRISSRKEPA